MRTIASDPRRWMVLAAALLTALCGCGGCGGDTTPGVTGIWGGPFSGPTQGVFLLQGTGFGSAGAAAQVRFTATSGTPFAGGTSATAMTNATVFSDLEVLGVTPPADGSGFTATMELVLGNGHVLPVPGTAQFEAMFYMIVDDVYLGGPGPDAFFGGAGNDDIRGAGGNDTLGGGADDDFLAGNDGDDNLSGGAGPDIFSFEPLPGTWNDVVQDFSPAEDLLWLEGVPADVSSLGRIANVTDAGPGGAVLLWWTGGGRVQFDGLGTGTRNSLPALLATGVRMRVVP